LQLPQLTQLTQLLQLQLLQLQLHSDGAWRNDDSFVMVDRWSVAREAPWWRGADCEDMAREAHVSHMALLRLAIDDATPPAVVALAFLASLYCPMLVEAAIAAKNHLPDPFARTNARPVLRDGTPVSLHAYFKLLPWPLVHRLCRGAPAGEAKGPPEPTVRLPPTPPAPVGSLETWRAWLRAAALPRRAAMAGDDLPVLAIEPTDHNMTNWSHTPAPVADHATSDLCARMRAYHSARDAKGNFVHPWTHHVHYLYPPTRFAQEGFYRYDLVGYSGLLYQLTGRKVPHWLFVTHDRVGSPPLGLLGRAANTLLVPGPTPANFDPAPWERLVARLPRLPPLRAPDAPKWAAVCDVSGVHASATDTASAASGVALRIFVRLGESTPDGVASDQGWTAEHTRALEQALGESRGEEGLKPLRVVASTTAPVVGGSEGLWILSLVEQD
jgi:hypothetical protein